MRDELTGHDVTYRVTRAPGPGTSPVDVVLVHGIGVSGRYFRPLERELAGPGGARRVVVVDLPGFGDSPRPDQPLDIGDHADVVLALIERLGLERPVVVGHSMGAQVVTEAAARRPDALGAAVLVGPVAEPDARTPWEQGARLLRDVRHERPSCTFLQVREYLRCGPRWYLATLGPMLAHPIEDRVADVRVPVLVVRGAHDPVAPTDFVDDLARRVGSGHPAGARGARRLDVPGTGHVVWWTQPWHLADAVLHLGRQVAADAPGVPGAVEVLDG